jgi:hypothetical protein
LKIQWQKSMAMAISISKINFNDNFNIPKRSHKDTELIAIDIVAFFKSGY